MAAERSIIEGSYKSKKYTDLTLVCEGVEFSAHRMVLCAKSPVFACQCDGSFEESRNRRVHVAIEDAPTLVMMLQYIYTGTYELQTGSEANASAEQMEDHEAEQAALLDLHRKITPNFALLAHLKVMCMADYYGVSDLIQRASHNFCQVLPCCYPSKKIDNYSAWKVEGFIDVAKKYYEQTPEHLQSQLGPQLREMMKANRVSFVHDDEFMQAASAIPAFMLDMLKHAHEDYHQERVAHLATRRYFGLLKSKSAQHVSSYPWPQVKRPIQAMTSWINTHKACPGRAIGISDGLFNVLQPRQVADSHHLRCSCGAKY